MSKIKNESKFEKKLKKHIIQIAIAGNKNPNNYSFVNKKNQIASLYLKMGQKMQSKKLKNTKSCSNLQNSNDSSKNNNSNNSFQLTNFSMLKNLKTNNNLVNSGFNTITMKNYEPKLTNKQNYIIHVNLNRDHNSSLSNFDLNNRINEMKNKKFKNKNIISLNNSELYNSIYCLSTREKFNYQKEESINLKRIKNNMKTKKFRLIFNERKKNKYISTSFCNLNISKNINKTLQKNENNNNNLSKNKLISRITKEKQYHHSKFNTMIIDEKDIDEIFIKNNIFKKKIIAFKSKNHIKHNNSVISLPNDENKNILNFAQFETKKYKNVSLHIKNALSINGNKICVNNKNNILSKKKSEISKNNKKFNYSKKINLKKKNKDSIIEKKIKINKKDLFQEIKNKFDNNEIKIKSKNAKMKKNNEKIKEFSKIIVLNDYKHKKTMNNFHTKNFNETFKTNTNNEILKKSKKELLERKNKLLLNNSKTHERENFKIGEKRALKPKIFKNNSIINDSLEQRITNNFINENNIKDDNLNYYNNNLNSTCFPFSLMGQKRTNYKKPLIKITTNKNISFNKTIENKESSNYNTFNNSIISSNNQNNLKNLIIKKKNNISNNSFYINKRLICYSSRDFYKKNIEINNILFDEQNLEALPEFYDEKFDDLYSIVHKINFGSVLIGAESFFTINSKKYMEFEYNFNNEFLQKFDKHNIEKNKSKYLKKILFFKKK